MFTEQGLSDLAFQVKLNFAISNASDREAASGAIQAKEGWLSISVRLALMGRPASFERRRHFSWLDTVAPE